MWSTGEADADASLAVAADLGGAADHPSDHRRLGEIAEGELARPSPILRLVEHEIDRAAIERRNAEGEERAEAEQERQRNNRPGDVRRRRSGAACSGFRVNCRGWGCPVYNVVRRGESLLLVGRQLPDCRGGGGDAYFRCHSGV